ncbi:putative Ig domain-containing protein [Geobacter sp.]|uniref:putative Ig domain-containing protein n=1 Tax=Geobacter sp. TaxID=46610 RepID=UPI002629B09D|nr:putative Ig domain-containing protein [Geobacter sp.]
MKRIVTLFLLAGSLLWGGRAGAAEWTLRNGASTASIDDAAPCDPAAPLSCGLFSWLANGGQEVMYQQWFWYREGESGPEAQIQTLTPGTPSATADSVTLPFVAADFDLSVTWKLADGGAGSGRSTITKTVAVTNRKSTPLTLHLYHYSDFDLDQSSSGADLAQVVEGVGAVQTKAYGAGTLVQSATLPPSRFDVDNSGFGTFAALNDGDPTPLSNFPGPLPAGDMNFTLQWDLTVPVGGSTTFDIVDRVEPTSTPALSLVHGGGCATYRQPVTATLALDNSANKTDSLADGRLVVQLPAGVGFVSATGGGVYDGAKGTVTWNFGTIAPGAAPPVVQLTVSADAATDFTLKGRFLSADSYPAEAADTVALCNHPPVVASVTSNSGFAVEAQPASWQINASDQDPGTTLTYALAKAPPGMTVSPAGVISWTPVSPFVGSVTVTIEVGDGALTTATDVSLYVYPGPHSGDLTNDQQVTVADVIEALKVAVKQKPVTPAILALGDVSPLVNGKPAPDGEITIQDVLLILKKALKLVTW